MWQQRGNCCDSHLGAFKSISRTTRPLTRSPASKILWKGWWHVGTPFHSCHAIHVKDSGHRSSVVVVGVGVGIVGVVSVFDVVGVVVVGVVVVVVVVVAGVAAVVVVVVVAVAVTVAVVVVVQYIFFPYALPLASAGVDGYNRYLYI